MDDKEAFEKVYEKPGWAVWSHEEPPEELVELVGSKKITPCKVLDIGCGEGFYSIYLAKKGFDVTGIDLSENAVKYAEANAEKAGVKINFKAMDIVNLSEIKEKFDFVLEWAIMHHLKPETREKYVLDVKTLLNKGGKYFSISFSDKDKKFGGPGKGARIIPQGSRSAVGMKLWFMPLEELKELFSVHFKLIDSREYEKMGPEGRVSTWNYLFMEK